MKSFLPVHGKAAENDIPVMNAVDGWFLFPITLLLGIGLIMVYSASSAVAQNRYGNDMLFLKKQAVFCVLGAGLLWGCRTISLRWIQRSAYPLLFGAIALLIAIQVPGLGVKAGGAVRWLSLGGLSFQPAEFARIALVIYLAYSLSKKKEKVSVFSIGFLPHVIILSVFVLLIMLQPDFGSAMMMFAVTWIMLFVGGVPLRHLLLSSMALLPVAYLFLKSSPYRMRRIIAFLDPWAYAADAGYQAVHSLMAFGTGGIWGVGLGNGYQKLFYLPEPHTDFIFAVIGEELGLLGVLGVIGCYLILIWKGIVAALKSEDSFACLLAVGLTMSLGTQALINMGVALSLLPTKGLTLPFVSYGGTSLLMNMAVIGLLMNVGREAVHGHSA